MISFPYVFKTIGNQTQRLTYIWPCFFYFVFKNYNNFLSQTFNAPIPASGHWDLRHMFPKPVLLILTYSACSAHCGCKLWKMSTGKMLLIPRKLPMRREKKLSTCNASVPYTSACFVFLNTWNPQNNGTGGVLLPQFPLPDKKTEAWRSCLTSCN